MVSVVAQSTVDRGFESLSGQAKEFKIGFCCLSAKHVEIGSKSKTGRLRIMKMCPSEAICLSADCCFSEI